MLFKRILFLVFIIYLFGINIHTFNLMGEDKTKAINNQWRIPEKELVLKAVIGGAIGEGIGMLYYWHKVRKPKFYIGIPILIVLNLIIYKIIYRKLLRKDNY